MSPTKNTINNTSVGNERFKADKRQIAGVLLTLSVVVTFFPLADISSLIGPNDTTPTEGIPLSALIGGLCIILMGITGIFTGYLALVHDHANKYLTGFLLLSIQTGYIPLVTDMTNVGKIARSGSGFIPEVLSPTPSQVQFVGAMGILGILCFGVCFLGSVAFMAFSLYAYQAQKPGHRASGYYRGRLAFYCILITLAGIAQLMLGSFVIHDFGNGPMEPVVNVAMFTVTFPEISVFVGLVYLLNGLYGLARALRFIDAKSHDHSFQVGIALQYFCTLVLMILVQVAYLPGNTMAAAAPGRACFTLGAHLLPAFLEYKMRSTPEILPLDYYGLGGEDDVAEDEDVETGDNRTDTSA